MPEYDPDASYSVQLAGDLIKKLRLENPDMKDPNHPIGAKQQYIVFQALPKKDQDAHLNKAIMEVLKFKQEQAALQPLPLAGNGMGKAIIPKAGKAMVFPTHLSKLKWVPFGHYLIAKDKLENNDQMVLARVKGGKVLKHPNRTVPASVKIALQAIIDGKPIPFEILPNDEKEWLLDILEDAKIQYRKKTPDPIQIRRTPKKIRIRMYEIAGEIAEGPNDNPVLKQEFKSLFKQALSAGMKELDLNNFQQFMATF